MPRRKMDVSGNTDREGNLLPHLIHRKNSKTFKVDKLKRKRHTAARGDRI